MRRLLLCSLVPLVLAAAVPAEARVRTGPAGLAFYSPPRPVPGRAHGDAIWQRRATGAAALAEAGRSTLVLYRSTGISGRPVAVSGVVSVPRGRPPKGGWPVVTWAHATTGIADQCAPSMSSPFGAAFPLNSYVYPLLNRWLRARWAVVRTDYEGLGTPGVHPYLNGRSEGRGVLDIVRAARQVDPRLSRRKVVIAGHSQGGHGALWAAALAPTYARDLTIRGTVAYAPASNLDDQARLIPAVTTPGGLSAVVSLILRGVDVSRPGLGVASLLSDRARALYPQTLSRCLTQLAAGDSFGSLAPAGFLRPGASIEPLLPALAATGPESLRIPTRVRVEQGTADTTVFKGFTDSMVASLRRRGARLDYHIYDGVTHGGIVTAAAAPSTAWIRQRLGR